MDTTLYEFEYDPETEEYIVKPRSIPLSPTPLPLVDDSESSVPSFPSSPQSVTSNTNYQSENSYQSESSEDNSPDITDEFLSFLDDPNFSNDSFLSMLSSLNVPDLKENVSTLNIPELVTQLFLNEKSGHYFLKTELHTVQTRDFYKMLLYGVLNLSRGQGIDNVHHIASKLWFERMDEPTPNEESIESNYGVLYFCRQNPSPKRNDEDNWVWGNDQRPDSKMKEPDEVQLRYWSYKNNPSLRRYAMRFMEAKEKAPKEDRDMDPEQYRRKPINILKELMVVHWVKYEDGRRKKTSLEEVSDNNNNVQPRKKSRKGIVMLISDSLGIAKTKYESSVDPCDRRLKTNIRMVPGGALDKIARMQAVSFIYKTDPNSEETLGFIAQELQEIDPRMVTERRGFLHIKPTAILALLAQAMQEMKMELQRHSEQISTLSQQSQAIHGRVAALEEKSATKTEILVLQQDVEIIKKQLTPPTPKAVVIPTDIPELDQQILMVLRDHGTLKAREIVSKLKARKVETSKTLVNQALYKRLGKYVDLMEDPSDTTDKKWKLK